ncbi:class I SAM-dependent methyltransferase [Sphingomonas nostoxanthinifaciens]|uniref:class I SAM-dependent methyltransferase n=1 Tax=Sphingomonas nostoxanthinifaciens TaxID=2872652 RepID=UPI001CC1E5F7|nr:methyltransferase [Sphingomonas nostoxanthinifaciens]UAK23980.1 methyltransferase [Sphingomonas nostoxanthinifaciens]
MIRACIVAAALAVASPAFSAAPAGYAAAIADPGRPAADTARDAERKPAEMLAFAGVKPGMVVMDLVPGGGYFTRLFSAAVGPKGKVIAYVPDEFAQKVAKALPAIQPVIAEPGRGNVMISHDPLMAPAPPGTIDIVWTSENYHDLHNLGGVDVAAFDKRVFDALRPGGVFVVMDHVAPAGSGFANTSDLHRVDPAAVRKEIESAGFKFDGESSVLANPDDPHTAKVFDPAIRGKTDKFLYRFRKPG